MRYVTRDRETGTIIEYFETKEEAEKAIQLYEEADKKDDVYSEDFYEVAAEPINNKYLEKGSYADFDESKVERAIKIRCSTHSWESIIDAIRSDCNEEYTPEELEQEMISGYLRLYKDGVVMLYL